MFHASFPYFLCFKVIFFKAKFKFFPVFRTDPPPRRPAAVDLVNFSLKDVQVLIFCYKINLEYKIYGFLNFFCR